MSEGDLDRKLSGYLKREIRLGRLCNDIIIREE